jgi:hypothetical protein
MHAIDRCRNSKLRQTKKRKTKIVELSFPKLLGFNFMRNVSESVWISDQTKVLADSNE